MPWVSGWIQRSGDGMKLRKLTKSEHFITRTLWEEIFTEDDKSFLDYYYQIKTADNSIYVIEETDDNPVSMLQLNPYRIQFLNRDKVLHYIIAVATRKEYRGRGYMTRLLEAAASDMYRLEEPFTFLMPAAEAIYYPHGFRFIYSQRQIFGKIKRIQTTNEKIPVIIREAQPADCHVLAEFAEKMLSRRELIRTVRTEQYYRTVLKEQQSEGGQILIAEKDGRITGFVLCGYEEKKAELREPFFETQGIWKAVLAFLRRREVEVFHVTGILPGDSGKFPEELVEVSEKEEPIIMARIIHVQKFLESFRANRNFQIRIYIRDDMIKENTGYWEIRGQEKENLIAEKREGGQNSEEITPGDLIMTLFGYRGGRREEKIDRNIVKELRILAEGTNSGPTVFLNEIV